jgi:hypothetical protein
MDRGGDQGIETKRWIGRGDDDRDIGHRKRTGTGIGDRVKDRG